MNKIVLDKVENELENVVGLIKIPQGLHKLIFKGHNKIVIEAESDATIIFSLLDNAYLDISIYNFLSNNFNITTEQYNNTFFSLKGNRRTNCNCLLNINGQILGNNNKNIIKIRTVSDNLETKIQVNVKINENTKDNELIEDIKGINHGGKVTILPDMEINTNEVTANHYVTIGKINDEDLFYLTSKGLSKEKSEELILNGFLKGIMEVNEFE